MIPAGRGAGQSVFGIHLQVLSGTTATSCHSRKARCGAATRTRKGPAASCAPRSWARIGPQGGSHERFPLG